MKTFIGPEAHETNYIYLFKLLCELTNPVLTLLSMFPQVAKVHKTRMLRKESHALSCFNTTWKQLFTFWNRAVLST